MTEEMFRSLYRLRQIKAMREIVKDKQTRLEEQTPWEKATLPREKVKET
jgi:hypothetical protein